MEDAGSVLEQEALSGRSGAVSHGQLPLLFQLRPEGKQVKTETWRAYTGRVEEQVGGLQERLGQLSSTPPVLLRAARAFALTVTVDQLHELEVSAEGRFLELDAPGPAFALDDAAPDVGIPLVIANHSHLDGTGVRVAVLDTGVDSLHPALRVAESHSTCNEPAGVPGSHGTAVAGCLASNDAAFRGVAPGVELVDIKVGFGNAKTAQPSSVLAGIDKALDGHAQVISMSLGFNHLPPWWDGGYGWSCPDGQCPLCSAIDRASTDGGALVVVAAGNEHQRAEAMRQNGHGASIPTELLCPGQARQALSVGALHKRTFTVWDSTSRAPSTYGSNGPAIGAPGVNVMTTSPVPRDAQGQPLPNPTQAQLFSRRTGTSIATPIVAGVAALVIQQFQGQGLPWTPASVARKITGVLSVPTGFPSATGAGRLDLFRL